MQNTYRVVAPDRYLQTRFIDGEVIVQYQNHSLIRTDMAVALLEGDRPAVTYLPMDELTGAVLLKSNTAYPCRWKGDAQYFDVKLPDGTIVGDGAWSYPEAPEEVAVLRTRLAFDTQQFSLVHVNCGETA